jgi:hypothetical protein
MNIFSKALLRNCACLLVSMGSLSIYADNQTADLSPVLNASNLPYRVVIETANFTLPVGFHSGAMAQYQGLWIFIAGRINGLHGFGGDPFPADEQNTSIFVVNPATGKVSSRNLKDPSSGLNQQQIDSLSVTSPQSYQDGETLYLSGGYGIDTLNNTFGTKPILTTVYLPGIIKWVIEPENPSNTVVNNIRQLTNPIFQISGGSMFKMGNMTQLVFGQNFKGVYTPGSNGEYSKQIRRFQINNSNGQLAVDIFPSKPSVQDPSYRRRDLNIVPILQTVNNTLKYGLIAYAGVFTLSAGVWTVPVIIDDTGNASMSDPLSAGSFKQAMNQYVCASVGLYSRKNSSMYNIFFGGISYGFYQNGVFQTDSEIPFINQVTTIVRDSNGHFNQYLMDTQYPTILSTRSNPGNTLLFGAGAYFVPTNITQYPNKVLSLDTIRRPTVIGYIVGGIQSTMANTNVDSDSAASPYVFKVTLLPN